MYTIKESALHGMGLFARKRIRKGTVLGRAQGHVTNRNGPHVLWVTNNIGVHVQNDFRFINHSPRPNAAYLHDTTVVALRDIEAGEEILHDYEGVACLDAEI